MVGEGQDGAILSVNVVFLDRDVFGGPDGIIPASAADQAEAMSFLPFGVALFPFDLTLSVKPGLSGLVCGALVDVPAGIATNHSPSRSMRVAGLPADLPYRQGYPLRRYPNKSFVDPLRAEPKN